MALVWVHCPPGPGGRLPSSQIEPSSEARKTCVVIMVLPVEERTFLHQAHRDFLITLYMHYTQTRNAREIYRFSRYLYKRLPCLLFNIVKKISTVYFTNTIIQAVLVLAPLHKFSHVSSYFHWFGRFKRRCEDSNVLYILYFGSYPGGGRFFVHVQTGPGAHPASGKMGIGFFPGVKRSGRGADHPRPPSAEVENE
jgi:hypothetical protein